MYFSNYNYCRQVQLYFFNIFRNVHLRIIMVDNQLDAQIFYNTFIYLNPLHVSSTFVLILRGTIV